MRTARIVSDERAGLSVVVCLQSAARERETGGHEAPAEQRQEQENERDPHNSVSVRPDVSRVPGNSVGRFAQVSHLAGEVEFSRLPAPLAHERVQLLVCDHRLYLGQLSAPCAPCSAHSRSLHENRSDYLVPHDRFAVEDDIRVAWRDADENHLLTLDFEPLENPVIFGGDLGEIRRNEVAGRDG